MESPTRTIWDIYQNSSKKIIIENIKKYLEAYDDGWIAIHEALQNGIDAVQRSEHPTGTVTVEVWLDTETVRITDNGRGFPPNLELLCPGITDKNESGVTKGYQGVGLKALMYSTSSFTIFSIYEHNKQWEFRAVDLYKLLEKESLDIEFHETTSTLNESRELGTQIEYSFPTSMLSSFIHEILDEPFDDQAATWRTLYSYIDDEKERKKAEISHAIRWYFQTKTYAADCNRLLDIQVKPVRTQTQTTYITPITICFVIHRPEKPNNSHPWLEEYFALSESDELSIEFQNKQWDFEEQVRYLLDQPTRFRRLAPDVEDFSLIDDEWKARYQSLKDRLYIKKLLPDHSKSEFSKRYSDFISLLTGRRKREVDWEIQYGALFAKILGIYLVIGRTNLFEKFGLTPRGERFIAANGIPTSHEIPLRSTSSTWYVETIHFIVNVDERLNYGKKQIANTRLIGKVYEYFADSYSKLMTISKAFVRLEDTRRISGSEIPTEFVAMRDLKCEGIHLIKVPGDENALIFLFAQLLAYSPLLQYLGTDEIELQIFGLHSKEIFDGKFRWNTEGTPTADNHLWNLEFKLNLTALIDEFDSAHSSKEFRDTHLIVVWEDDIPRHDPEWRVRGVDPQRRRELDLRGVPSFIQDVLEYEYTAETCPIIVVQEWLQASGCTDD